MSGDVGSLRDALHAHQPVSAREARSQRRTLGYLSWLRDPFSEQADPTHVTASAIVIDGAGNTVLHRHKRLGIWLQPGGHIDPGESPADGALREAIEETGLDVRHPATGARLLHVDVHQGPRGHVHLDVRYLLHAAAGAIPAPPEGESQEVAWFTYAEASGMSDISVADALRAI